MCSQSRRTAAAVDTDLLSSEVKQMSLDSIDMPAMTSGITTDAAPGIPAATPGITGSTVPGYRFTADPCLLDDSSLVLGGGIMDAPSLNELNFSPNDEFDADSLLAAVAGASGTTCGTLWSPLTPDVVPGTLDLAAISDLMTFPSVM